ncbi:MAG: chloride channel protein, partial [Clostridia bacterium]
GDRVYFNFPFEYLPLSKYPYLLLIGLCAGVFGAIFNKLLLATKPFFLKMQTKKFNFNLLIPFLLAGVIGLFLFDATGGGFATISKLFSDNLTLKMIAMVLVVRFLYTIICANSNMIGGLFVPMLCLGALLGGLLFGLIAKIDASLPKNLLILLTMLG